MIASLRARLLAGLLALTAAGMLIAGAVTYAEQRSFLLQRADEQTRDAPFVLGRALDGDDGDDGPRPGGPGGNDGGPLGPPAGTYGELRTPAGTKAVTLPVGSGITAKPDLPRDLPLGKLVTVAGDDGRYRVLAQRDPRSGGILVSAVPLREADQQLDRLLLVEALVIGVVLLLLGLAGWVVVRVGLLPLDRIGHTAGRIAGGDLSHRVDATDPRTEVGRLGIALNRMLDRLEEAFTRRQESENRLRTFIADASHELRTPLASIRGYAELFRMGAVPDAERERALRRIEDEAARMGVLVEDLLTLARLDEIADAPHTELDLAVLAGDAVDDARATAPDRAITFEAQPTPVLGDGHQLRQVLANLLRNALVHTPAGTPIDVSVIPAGDVVSLVVRDHGPGLPTEDADEIFERFWRAEGGRKQGKGGAGLGLAIVVGIVDAHRGRVSAANADGGGAAFVVELPALSKL
ncbi:MAG TPA: HAMP domain-containing sensor histidine kinase [Solirubrobacteraceae bacterium]|nr:HAMP domain-containing sensor histidine kinase [Solirubrobacteraceae bacterium]